MMIGIKWNCITVFHANIVIKNPTMKGLSESPMLAPTPCIDNAMPRLDGNLIESLPIAVGCHKALDTPIKLVDIRMPR